MKFSLTTALALVLPLAMAKKVIISYPSSTPDNVVEDAIRLIDAEGGHITHKYRIIKGFAAEVPEAALDVIRTHGGEHIPTIEDDTVMSIST